MLRDISISHDCRMRYAVSGVYDIVAKGSVVADQLLAVVL